MSDLVSDGSISDRGTIRDSRLYGLIWHFIHPYRTRFAVILVMLVLTVIISISSPLAFNYVIELITDKSGGSHAIIQGLWAYFILTVAYWIVDIVLFVLFTQVAAKFIKDLRIDAYKNVLDNSQSFFDAKKAGDLSSRLVYDTSELKQTIMQVAWFFISLLELIITISILFYFSTRVALVVSLAIPIILIFAILLSKWERRKTKQWRVKFSEVNHKFTEIMGKIQISKTFNREEENLTRFRDINEETFKASVQRGLAIFIFWPATDLFKHFFTIVVIAFGAMEVEAGNLSLATFILFIILINYFYWPLIGLAESYRSVQDAMASLSRIAAIAFDDELREIDEGIHSADEIIGKIEFRNMSFGYDEKQVLRNIDLVIEPGQRVAIVGSTGAGKTTIASLLMRFYTGFSGDILLDDRSIDSYDLDSYRSNISMVSQKILLFSGSIRDNLLLSNSQLDDDKLWEILEQVQAREFIEALPHGIDTMVEENGKNLSIGQRQMISFARALLSDAKIILLDEATASVDLYTESKILEAIDVVLRGRTAISIAHRLTTILRSDLIVVLSNGELVEYGTHEELLDRGGEYAEMYNLYMQTQSAKYLNDIIRH